MTARERFASICAFEPEAGPYIWSAAAWPETLERWAAEGMPVVDRSFGDLKEVNALLLGDEHRTEAIPVIGAISGKGKNGYAPWIVAVEPYFERRVLSETAEHVIEVDWDGTIVERKKEEDDTIPRYLEYPVKDRASWREFSKRLDPHSPGRWPADWKVMSSARTGFPLRPELEGRSWEERDFPLGMNLLSLYGNPRNYMGVENLSLALYDDPLLVEEMVEHQAWMAYEMAKKVFDEGVSLDWVWLWEDMCFNKGPLVSPAWVRRVMVPHYRKVVDLLRSHGVSALILDCDGNIDELLPLWVDCGINATYPLERAAGMDARKVRATFGNDLIIIGNVDKRALALGKKEIDAEVELVAELTRGSGYFANADHHVPPDVSWENFAYFLERVKAIDSGL